MNKIFVTGGAGFVGSVLIPYLLDRGYRVRVYDSLLYGINGLFGCFNHPNFEFIKGDIRDISLLRDSAKGCDAIIHLAALVGYPICKKDEQLAMSVNKNGTQSITEAVSSNIPIIFSSTGSCYGNVEGICHEELPLRPLTIYGKSKADAEEAIKKRGNFIIYRFATGYGISPRMRLDLMINDFCFKAVKEKNLVVYERHFRRTFIHVLDMARAFHYGLKEFEKMKDGIFNVGSEEMNLSKQDICELIKEKVPDFYLHYADIGHDEDKRDYEVSYQKIKRVGFNTIMNLDASIDRLIGLFKSFEIRREYSNV